MPNYGLRLSPTFVALRLARNLVSLHIRSIGPESPLPPKKMQLGQDFALVVITVEYPPPPNQNLKFGQDLAL